MCSICAAPSGVQQSINSMLKQKISMKKIALASGISKAAIGRHSLRCLSRKAANSFKSLSQQIAIVCWPDGRCHRLFSDKILTVEEVNRLPVDDYFILKVEYEKLSAEATANSEACAQREADRAAMNTPPESVAVDDTSEAKATPCKMLTREEAADLKRQMESRTFVAADPEAPPR
jgi:hypothetical protein